MLLIFRIIFLSAILVSIASCKKEEVADQVKSPARAQIETVVSNQKMVCGQAEDSLRALCSDEGLSLQSCEVEPKQTQQLLAQIGKIMAPGGENRRGEIESLLDGGSREEVEMAILKMSVPCTMAELEIWKVILSSLGKEAQLKEQVRKRLTQYSISRGEEIVSLLDITARRLLIEKAIKAGLIDVSKEGRKSLDKIKKEMVSSREQLQKGYGELNPNQLEDLDLKDVDISQLKALIKRELDDTKGFQEKLTAWAQKAGI